MPSLYAPAPLEVNELVEQAINEFHPALRDMGVSVDVLFATAERDRNGDPKGPALTHNGYPALGMASVTDSKSRAKGLSDCEIVLDGDRWYTLSDREKLALLDHELTHFELKVDRNGVPLRDARGRPMLRLRRHDRQFGWFDEIARRHGEHSVEVQQAHELFDNDDARQLYLAFVEAKV